jgi:hypothetical protein
VLHGSLKLGDWTREEPRGTPRSKFLWQYSDLLFADLDNIFCFTFAHAKAGFDVPEDEIIDTCVVLDGVVKCVAAARRDLCMCFVCQCNVTRSPR